MLGELMIDPCAPEHGQRPIGFVDLAACGDAAAIALPPWPVIGLGPRDHPLAQLLDAVCEPPVTPASLIEGASAAPGAAAVAAQVLRAGEGLSADAALTLESLAYAALQAGGEHGRWLAAPRAPATPPGTVRLDREGDRLAVTLDRPWALNAVDRAMRDGLAEAFTLADLDPSIARVVVSAAGRAFSIGGDLAEFGTTRDPVEAHRIRAATLPAHPLVRIGGRVEVRVAGACVGAGLEMAAFARRIVAGRRAWFQLPELRMGLIPGAGGCVSVPRRIGRGRALLMILSGRRLDAATALRWGLIDALVDDPAADPGGVHAHGGEMGAG